ncbi:MAG: cytochrome C biogenesis protein [Candidatus Margulisbacteria bacterium GWF2_35_9]|nr:MAG: cytochrome C biogenesis protein [Candidatus Margulisbacteria bacterium GWF2_35_9]
MLLDLFNSLTGALYGSPVLALITAFVWGILSILLSPCHLSSIPLVIGFVSGMVISQEKPSIKKAFLLSTLFSLGILLSIAVIAVITSLMGRIMGDIGPISDYLLAMLLVITGIYLLEIIRLPFINTDFSFFKRKGYLAALILGGLMGMALGPCTFAFMMPVLGVAFQTAGTHLTFSLGLVLMYALGHCSVIILAGTLTEAAETWLKWNRNNRAVFLIKKICGVLLIAAGIGVGLV